MKINVTTIVQYDFSDFFLSKDYQGDFILGAAQWCSG